MSIASNVANIQEQIAEACRRSGRAEADVALMAVSKMHPADAIAEACAAGLRLFGENRVQEWQQKQPRVAELMGAAAPPQIHLIGPLQSNKTRPVAEHFDWVHSIDRLKIAQRLSEQRPDTLPPLNVCLQVNVSGEASKSGVAPEDAPAVAREIASLPKLRLRGLMSIPEPAADLAAQREPHRILRELYETLRAQGVALDTLSMGMSGDLEAAVLEGATMVRIGTAIFGKRDYAH